MMTVGRGPLAALRGALFVRPLSSGFGEVRLGHSAPGGQVAGSADEECKATVEIVKPMPWDNSYREPETTLSPEEAVQTSVERQEC